jgi:hypothetical protein
MVIGDLSQLISTALNLAGEYIGQFRGLLGI